MGTRAHFTPAFPGVGGVYEPQRSRLESQKSEGLVQEAGDRQEEEESQALYVYYRASTGGLLKASRKPSASPPLNHEMSQQVKNS